MITIVVDSCNMDVPTLYELYSLTDDETLRFVPVFADKFVRGRRMQRVDDRPHLYIVRGDGGIHIPESDEYELIRPESNESAIQILSEIQEVAGIIATG